MSRALEETLGQVNQKILHQEFDDIDVSAESEERIFQLFWRGDVFQSIASYRPYFDFLKEFLKNKPNKKFSRPEYYKFVIARLAPEASLRKHLQLIATSMELMEVNGLTEEKFDELLTKLGFSRKKLQFKKLLKENLFKIGPEYGDKENDVKVQFFHHSIQEYLATQYIIGAENPLQYLRELVCVKQGTLLAIKPSWYYVIRFLVEIETSSNGDCPILDWLLKLGKESPDEVINELYAVAITSIHPKKTLENMRKEVYALIYKTYRDRLLWLPIWTRDPLAQIITNDQIEDLKKDINEPAGGWENEKQRYFTLGYATEIVGGLMKHKRLTQKDKDFWLTHLIEFANDTNDNGVLQRNALNALKYCLDRKNETHNIEELINKVQNTYKHKDELVLETFLEFVSEVAPNSKEAIDFASQAVGEGMIGIYGRHALYKIDKIRGIIYLLEKLSTDSLFLFGFLDQESIFNDRDKKSDKVLIDQIEKHAKKVLKLITTTVIKSYKLTDYYDHERSYFLTELVRIAIQSDPKYFQNFLHEIISIDEESQRKNILFYARFHLAQAISTTEDVDVLFDLVNNPKYKDDEFSFQEIIRIAHDQHNAAKPYEYALRKEYVKEQPIRKTQNYEEIQKREIIQRFRDKLEPAPGQYITDVFSFYLEHDKELKDQTKDIQRLKKLVVNSGLKIDPRKIKVTKADKISSSYSITQTAHMFGPVVRVAQKLGIKIIPTYRQKVIDFIPYAYSDDQGLIFEMIKDIKDKDLEQYVNPLLLDETNDARYLIPSGYIYLIERYAKAGNVLKSAVPVLKSLIKDKWIEQYVKRLAIETLALIVDQKNNELKKFLQDIWTSNARQKDAERQKLAETANAVLISVFKDQKAIKWRFDEILKRAQPFTPPVSGKAHSVGKLENELNSLFFAKPLIELKDPKLLSDYYFKFIDKGFALLGDPKKKEYESYAYYLFKIVSSAVLQMASQDTNPLNTLKRHLKKYAKDPNINWWNMRMEELNKVYIGSSESEKNIDDIVKMIRGRRKNG